MVGGEGAAPLRLRRRLRSAMIRVLGSVLAACMQGNVVKGLEVVEFLIGEIVELGGVGNDRAGG